MDRCSASCCARVANGSNVDGVALVSASAACVRVGVAIPFVWAVVIGFAGMARVSGLRCSQQSSHKK